jgi:cytochrome c heme-lyase
VDHGKAQKVPSSWNPTNWFSTKKSPTNTPVVAAVGGGGCPVKHDSQAADGCPVKHDGKSPFSIPASIEEAARHAQSPHADQRIPLSTNRVTSTIPRADELRPAAESAPHQDASKSKWVYPSEQQFYNAMRRKGWSGIDEGTIPFVVRIHNAVNERGWAHVRKWEEELHDNPNPRLVRFLGRPKDTSPKAFLNTYLFWYNAPFDRHDWFIDRGDGKEPRRYVIDFYNGEEGGGSGSSGIVSSVLNRFRGKEEEQPAALQQAEPVRPPSMYLDVRPALDTPEAFSDRLQMFFIDGFPGIYAAFKQSSGSSLGGQVAAASNTSNTTRTEEKSSPD